MVGLNAQAAPQFDGDPNDALANGGIEMLKRLAEEARAVPCGDADPDAWRKNQGGGAGKRLDETGPNGFDEEWERFEKTLPEGWWNPDHYINQFEAWRREERRKEAALSLARFDGSELPPGAYIDSGKELKAFPYLIKGAIPRRGRGILVGQSGVAKTGLLVHLLTACASFGILKDAESPTFFGRKIKEQVGAVMFVAEGEGEIEYRMRAARRQLGIDDDRQIPLLWCTKEILKDAPNLRDPDGKERFIEFCQKSAIWMQRNFSVRLGLYAVDTEMAAYNIVDENDNSEIAAIAESFGSIGKALGGDCFGINVVHAGKDATKGARGASARRDNYDIMLMASGDRNEIDGTCKNRRLALSKNRFGQEGIISAYDVGNHVLGQDEDGDDFGALVVYLVDRAVKPEKKRPKRKTAYRAQFEQAFNNAIIEHPTKRRLTAPFHVGTPEVTAVDVEYVRAEFYRVCIVDSKNAEMTTDAKRSAFNRELAALFEEYPQEEDVKGRWIWKA